MIRLLALLAVLLPGVAFAEISPCDAGGESVPERVALLEGAILFDVKDDLEAALPNIPEDARQATVEWLSTNGHAFIRCDTVYSETFPPNLLRRAVVFEGPETGQLVGLYMDVVSFRDRTEIVLFNLTPSIEGLLELVR